jgi:hypothetical protein
MRGCTCSHEAAFSMSCRCVTRLPEGSAGSHARTSPQSHTPGSDQTSAASVTPADAFCYLCDLLLVTVPHTIHQRCEGVQMRTSHPAVSGAWSDRKQAIRQIQQYDVQCYYALGMVCSRSEHVCNMLHAQQREQVFCSRLCKVITCKLRQQDQALL